MPWWGRAASARLAALEEKASSASAGDGAEGRRAHPAAARKGGRQGQQQAAPSASCSTACGPRGQGTQPQHQADRRLLFSILSRSFAAILLRLVSSYYLLLNSVALGYLFYAHLFRIDLFVLANLS